MFPAMKKEPAHIVQALFAYESLVSFSSVLDFFDSAFDSFLGFFSSTFDSVLGFFDFVFDGFFDILRMLLVSPIAIGIYVVLGIFLIYKGVKAIRRELQLTH